MKKMFRLVKYNDVPEDIKTKVITNLYHEIKRQAKKEKHSKRYLLDLVFDYRDIYDLVEVFLE